MQRLELYITLTGRIGETHTICEQNSQIEGMTKLLGQVFKEVTFNGR